MLSNIGGVFSPGPDPYAEERRAKLAALRERVDAELKPAMRAAARSLLAYMKAAARARLVYLDLAAAGLELKVPEILHVEPEAVTEAARVLIEGGMIDVDDSILDGLTS